MGAIGDAYLRTDRDILGYVEKGGSTAVTAMVCDHDGRVTVVVANVGDSRAVLCKAGKAMQLFVDHNPRRPTKQASVEARGGHVTHLPGSQWRVDGHVCNKIAEAFFNNIGTKIESFFGEGDSLPWIDSKMIASCKLEASGEKAVVSGDNSDGIMRLAWTLVHLRNAPNVQRGIVMLEAALAGVGAPLQKREILYLLAVGQFRVGEYARSRRLLDQALSILLDFRHASTLKKMVEDKISKDSLVGVGLAAAAVGVVASGIAAVIIGGCMR